MLMAHGYLRQIFEIFDKHRCPVDVVSTSEVSVSLTVDSNEAIPDIAADLEAIADVKYSGRKAIVCLVGENIREKSGVAAQVFTALEDIKQTFGMVPDFLRRYPQEGLAGAWTEMRDVEMNPSSAIPGKYKSLMGLAVASQIPCKFCIVADTEFANKIESFTIKQGVKALHTGVDRFPQIEPTKIEFPNIVGTIAVAKGGGMQAWYEDCIANGMSDDKSIKQGALEFLGPDKSKVLFRITLKDVGLLSYKIMPSTANSDQIKRGRFEMYVGAMELDGSGDLARG